MLPSQLKSLIEEYCMGIQPTDTQIDEIMDLAISLSADSSEVAQYIEKMQQGPTKEERDAIAKAEAERKAKEEAKRKAEAERKAKDGAERKAKEEAKRKAEAERKAKDEAERKVKEAAERKAEAERKAKEEAERKAKDRIYWPSFIVLLLCACTGAMLFVDGVWDNIVVWGLIVISFGMSLLNHQNRENSNVIPCTFAIMCAGILLQHYYVHGFWLTTLALVLIVGLSLVLGRYVLSKVSNLINIAIITIIFAIVASLFLFVKIEEEAFVPSEYALSQDNSTSKLDAATSNLSVKEQLQLKYDYVYSIDSKKRYKVEKNDKYGYHDKDGKLLIPAQYDHIYSEDSKGMMKVEINDKYGLVDTKTYKLVLPVQYDYIYSEDSKGMIKVEINDKYGLVDTKTYKLVVPVEYDYFYSESNGLIKVQKGDKYGFLNATTYQLVTPCVYDYIYSLDGNLIKVEKNGKVGYLNKDGSLLKEPV